MEQSSNRQRHGADNQSIVQTTTTYTHPSMTPTEKTLWSMSFEDLYQQALKKGFAKSGKESRKSGRVRIIRWLCSKEGITPYVAPSLTPITPTPSPGIELPTGAISHPEAILSTSDPTLQSKIDSLEKSYLKRTHNSLLALAMERSYQLLKDSKGKLPSRCKTALANWLASWDVLKSDREKKWWLGDGIDLANKAKAMGYAEASSKKYDIILWLRNTPEDTDVEVTVAKPTSNKRSAEEGIQSISKRQAKGSRRPRINGVTFHNKAKKPGYAI